MSAENQKLGIKKIKVTVDSLRVREILTREGFILKADYYVGFTAEYQPSGPLFCAILILLATGCNVQ